MELSIIIPVYKESRTIHHTLAHLFSLGIPQAFEVVVVDGEKALSTLRALEKTPGLPPQVRPIPSARGRGLQMNAGAVAARGDLFFFLHADTRLDQAGMDEMLAAWHSRRSSRFCGAFDLAIDSPKPWFRLIEKTASIRSRLTRLPYGDQGIFISRHFFTALGGFPRVPLMEDVGLMRKIRRHHVRPVFLPHAVKTSARRWESRGVIHATIRNWVLILLFFARVPPERLAKFY